MVPINPHFGNFEYVILIDGTVEITRYIGTDRDDVVTITIPSEIDVNSDKAEEAAKRAFWAIEDAASASFFFSQKPRPEIKPEIIPEIKPEFKTVTSIGPDAFCKCRSLRQITIPDSVTKIGNSAFKDCYSLTEITIPDSVTKIGDYAFEDCYSLKQITIPDSVTKIGDYAFKECSLTEIAIPDSVTSIGEGAFDFNNIGDDCDYV